MDAKVPFKSIFTTDCAGQQTWSMGHNVWDFSKNLVF